MVWKIYFRITCDIALAKREIGKPGRTESTLTLQIFSSESFSCHNARPPPTCAVAGFSLGCLGDSPLWCCKLDYKPRYSAPIVPAPWSTCMNSFSTIFDPKNPAVFLHVHMLPSGCSESKLVFFFEVVRGLKNISQNITLAKMEIIPHSMTLFTVSFMASWIGQIWREKLQLIFHK